MFFVVRVIGWGYPLQTLTQRTFREKSFGISKAFAKIKWRVRWEVFADFQGAFYKKPLEERFGTSVPTYNDNKKTRHCRVFCVRCQLGLSAPNPDTRDFSRKVPWNLKSFAKIKWVYFRYEVLWLTFLSRKVSSFAYFSQKEK